MTDDLREHKFEGSATHYRSVPGHLETVVRNRVELVVENESTGFEVRVEVYHPDAGYTDLADVARAALDRAIEIALQKPLDT